MTRLANTSFLSSLLGAGGATVFSYFSRPKNMVDGDYAQMISINSELRTNAYQAENYTSATSVFLNGGKASDGIFGIFYSADNQTRDYVTPKRTIINPNIPLTNNCAFNNFGAYSQVVPFYEWEIKKNNSTNPGPPNPVRRLLGPFLDPLLVRAFQPVTSTGPDSETAIPSAYHSADSSRVLAGTLT